MDALKSQITSLRRRIRGREPGSAKSPGEALRIRQERRNRLKIKTLQYVPYLRVALLVGGYAALLALPTDLLSRGTYISENAIQPGQVNTYWSWHDVAIADQYARDVERWALLEPHDRATAISAAFASLGLPASTQRYSFHPSSHVFNGTNAFSILPSTRTDGAESLVLMASWKSRLPDGNELVHHEGQYGQEAAKHGVNVRGVASVLALAEYLRKFSLWSKDIVFLVADGYVEGTQAFLQAFHGVSQRDAVIEPLELTTGGIWASIALDYPFHSFEHLEIYYEGIDGQLPNLDLINTIVHIARWTGGVPVRLHAHRDDPPTPLPLPTLVGSLPPAIQTLLASRKVLSYYHSLLNLLSQSFRGAINSPSGPEGLFSSFRISSLALYAPPSQGPHGFHAMGKTVESSMRSLNNLLEALHQSFWLYLMQGTERFVSVANYIVGPLAISIAVTVTGLEVWAATFSVAQVTCAKDRQSQGSRAAAIASTLQLLVASHAIGLSMLGVVYRLGLTLRVLLALSTVNVAVPILAASLINRLSSSHRHIQSLVSRSIVLVLVGCVLAVVSVLSFSVGAALVVIYGVPLCFFRPTGSPTQRWSQFLVLVALNPAIGAAVLKIAGRGSMDGALQGLLGDWQILGTWFLPFTLAVTLPLLMQVSTACLVRPA